MPGFPKTVTVRGVDIQAHSWEELDELLARYGTAQVDSARPRAPAAAALSTADRALLQKFVSSAERGVLVNDVRLALGATGKVGPALKVWSRTIGLEQMSAAPLFVPVKTARGRAHRLSANAINAARALLSAE